jgi:glycosyltransferase involved in cell wall biosynthesis
MRSGRTTTLAAVGAGPTRKILALWAFPSGHWARQAAMAKKVPYQVWTLGSDVWSLGRIPVVRGVIKRVLRDAKTVYSDGIRLAEDTSALGGRKVEFLPSARSINRAKASSPRGSAPYRMTFLGRWHPNKGIDLLLEALESLEASDWERIDSVRIHGGGPLEAEVVRRVVALIDAGHPVSVGGYLNKAHAEDLIAGSDWLILPSRIESIPVIFSDAIKLHTPLVATPVGDLPELMREHDAGILCDSATAGGIRAGIRLALQSSAKARMHDMEVLSLRFSLRSSIVPELLRYESTSGS